MKQTFLDLVDSARLSSLLLDVITELFRSLSPFPRSPAVSAINSTQKSECYGGGAGLSESLSSSKDIVEPAPTE